MKVLITGGMGFIGSFLADALVEEGCRVTLFDNLDEQVHPGRSIPNYYNQKAQFIRGDVRDYEHFKSVLSDDYEVIFHFLGLVYQGTIIK